jgi:hypothetical protein
MDIHNGILLFMSLILILFYFYRCTNLQILIVRNSKKKNLLTNDLTKNRKLIKF